MSSPGQEAGTPTTSGGEEISQAPFQRVLEWSMAPTEVGKDGAKNLDDLKYLTVSRAEKASTQHGDVDSSPDCGVKAPGRKSVALEEAATAQNISEAKAVEGMDRPATAPAQQLSSEDASSARAAVAQPPAGAAPQQTQAAAAPAASQAGRPAFKLSVEDFEFGRQLGEGSYARVVQATRISTGEDYAIKIMDKVFVRKQKKVKNVTVERNALNILDHPNILKLMCTFQDPDSLYIVLEFAEGGELFQKIRGLGAVSLDNARYWIAEIVLALQHMHGRGVLHRDLKPENILLCKEGHVKIGDFGSAKLMSDEDNDDSVMDKSNTFCGTAEYVSPEMLKDMTVTESSDLWALGCTAYQLLAGIPPFKGQSEYLIFEKILERNFQFPEDFPEDAKDFVEKLLVLDPKLRLGSGPTGYAEVKSHPFFNGLDFDALERGEIPPPPIKPRATPSMLNRSGSGGSKHSSVYSERDRMDSTDSVYDPSKWERFLFDGETMLMCSKVTKLKAFGRSKIRQLILTSFPRLIYIDSKEMIQKGEIPWSDKLKAEVVNLKKFNVVTPGRTYNLEDFAGEAQKWVDEINGLVSRTSTDLGTSS